MNSLERLIAKREIDTNGCWLWIGSLHPNGYASTTQGSRRSRDYIHRIAYRAIIGPIPLGKELDHLCRVRHCFNPQHLEPVTRIENVRRGIGPAILGRLNGSKTHCIRGHAFDEYNTRLRPTGGRDCRACARLHQTEYRKARRHFHVAD